MTTKDEPEDLPDPSSGRAGTAGWRVISNPNPARRPGPEVDELKALIGTMRGRRRPPGERKADETDPPLLRAGRVVHIPSGRLALADLHLMTGGLGEAKANLDEALRTAARNCTELHQADCHLRYARLYLELSDNEKARDSWAEAKEIIDRCGYHLRDAESHLLCARLYIARGEKEMAQGSLASAKEMSEQMGYRHCEGDIRDTERRLLGYSGPIQE